MTNLLIAARSLLQHKRRSFLLGGAIAGVTTLLVVMLGLFGGIESTILESSSTMTGHINVAGFFKVTAGQSSPVVTDYKPILALLEREIPEVSYIAVRGRGWAKMVSESGAMDLGIAGVDIEAEPGLKEILRVTKGSFDALKEPRTIMIFEEQATKLGVGVGDAITISAPALRGMNNTLDVTVGAIAADIGLLSSWNTFTPNSAVRQLYLQNETTVGALQLYLKDIKQVPRVEERVRQVLAAAGHQLMDKDPRAFWFKFEVVNREAWTGQKLDVTTWEDEISFIKTTVTAITVLGNALIFILLIVISVGIMNTLWIAIRERTREIGTLRAIGMQKGNVVRMFLTEAFLLAAGSTLLGSALGVLICLSVNAAYIAVPASVQLFLMRDHLLLATDPGAIASGVVLIVAVTTAIALIPSFLAARLKPVTAMSSVG